MLIKFKKMIPGVFIAIGKNAAKMTNYAITCSN